ncbi:MAG: HupE/UreJ family protein [Pseudorhodoplanes sp.]
MRLRVAAFAVLCIATSGSAAEAHDIVEGVGGFQGGFLHPLLVPAQALTLLAFGLMTGQQAKPSRMLLSALFPAALIAGIALIVAAYSLTIAQTALLACAAAAGLLTALAQPLLRIVPAVILGAGALSLIFDSVPSVISRLDTIVALCGTALSAALAVGLIAFGASCLTRDWQQIGVRILGSWTAASAILVLALRLAK